MPNWNFNRLTVSGKRKDVGDFKKKAVREYSGKIAPGEESKTDLSFNNFVPMPKELENTQSPYTPETAEEKQKSKYLINKFGADNWYDWAIMNWGVKWDASNAALIEKHSDLLIYEFDTAWGPPKEWLKKTSLLYPELEFTMEYEEPGMAFAGTYHAQGGDTCDEPREYVNEEELEEV